MASSDEDAVALGASGPRGSNAGIIEGAGNNQGRRGRSKEYLQEFHDELAQETKRVTLLDREEQQLKGRNHVSRLVFCFGTADDKKLQSIVEQEFSSWRNNEGGIDVTGVLLFFSHGQSAVCFLEGPTELLFKGLELFHGLSQDVQAAATMPLPPSDMRTKTSVRAEAEVPAAAPRAALISAVRILYFTELHGVRTSIGFCSCVSGAKLATSNNNLEDGVQEFVFEAYRKLLVLCLKVSDSARSDETDPDVLQGLYRKNSDFMPSPEEVALLLSKAGAEHFFSFTEFQKVFMKPFQLVLNSELLWPMPPALSY